MRFFYFLNRFATSRLTLGVLILILLACLIWFFGPKIEIDEAAPLASQTSRLIAIGVLVLLFLLLEVFRRWRLARINRRVLNNIERAQGETAEISDRVGNVRESFTALCETLRERMGVRPKDRRYIYDISWYLLLGETGSGRSTALGNSGLDFPLELASDVEPSSVPNFRGYCGWRVTDEAVFIDAPGAFVTPDDPSGTAEWQDLLDCLKSARVRCPLNGVILTLPVDQLTGESIDFKIVDVMRQRLQEIMMQFGTTLPVYILITKCDKIAGFIEYFSDLNTEEREGPLGFALPLEAKSTHLAPGPGLAAFSDQYRDFIAHLAEWVSTRLPAERELDSRHHIFAFPQQMHMLRKPLETTLQRIFGPSRFHRDALLRGVYFCSACQEGPITDLLMKAHKKTYDLQPSLARVHSPRRNTAFFFKGLIENVILPEQHLAGVNPKIKRRRRLTFGSAWTMACVVFAGLLGAWWLASASTKQQAIAIREALDAHETQRATLHDQTDFTQVALAVAPLSHIPNETTTVFQPLVASGAFMLRSPVVLSEQMMSIYGAALHTMVRPAVINDLGEEVAALANAGGQSTDRLRDLFRLYLSLSDLSHFDATRLHDWAAEHARAHYPLHPQQQTAIAAVVGDAFEELDTPLSLDENVLASARKRLNEIPPAERIYAQMKEGTETLQKISLKTALDETARGVFVATNASVQGYYSEPGFYEHFLMDAPGQIRDWNRDWLSEHAGAIASDEQLFDDVKVLYARDYITAWRRFLGNLALQPAETPDQILRLIETLLSSDSPLDGLIGVVSKHTILPLVRGSDEKKETADGDETEDGGILTSLGIDADEAVERKRGQWPGTRIGRAFAAYRNLRDDNTGDLPGLSDIRTALSDLHGVISAVTDESEPEAAAFEELRRWIDNPREAEVSVLRSAATPQPQPLRRMLFDLSDQSLDMMMALARQYLDQSWRGTVLSECRRAIAGRYPINRRAETAIAPDDFEAFFAQDGAINAFFKEQVGPFVETSGGPWVERSIYGHEIGFSENGLQIFRNANTIRDAFGLNGAGLSDLGFTIIPTYLDNKAMRVTVKTESETLSYRHEPPRRFRMAFADEAVSIGIADRSGTVHTSRAEGPWAWFRIFDRFELRPTHIPDQFDLTVSIGDMMASFRIIADSTVNPFMPKDFKCEESLQ